MGDDELPSGESRKWVDADGSVHWIVRMSPDGLAVWKARKQRELPLLDGRKGTVQNSRQALSVNAATLERLNSNERGTCVTVVYRRGMIRAAFSRSPVAFFNIWCSSREKRDELLASARAAFGFAYEYRREVYTISSAALNPLILIGLVAIFSWSLGAYAADATAGVPFDYGGRFEWLMNLIYPLLARLGQVGVWTIGSIVGFGLLVWLIRRIQDPPVLLTLVRRNRQLIL